MSAGNGHKPKEVFLVTCFGILLSTAFFVEYKHLLVKRVGTQGEDVEINPNCLPQYDGPFEL